MLNLLKKTTPWMVASLFVATSVFGQDSGPCAKPCAPKCDAKPCPPKPCPKPCPQPCPPTQVCPQDPCCPAWPTPVLNAAYNYPARTQTRCPWDLDFNVSFIYWQPIQENMELGFENVAAPVNQAFTTNGISADTINMDFNYKPGFTIGAGGYFDHDNWDVQLLYTWFHNTNNQSATAQPASQIFPAWGIPAFNGANVYNTASERWTLKMDLADIDLGRWYYVGMKLTFRPSFGARAAWIRQNVNVVYQNVGNMNVGTADTQTLQASSSSWAIGAKAKLDTNWIIGSGFRLFGSGEGDLLFTKYTRRSLSQIQNPTTVAAPFTIRGRRIYAVRPHLDLELGLAWGTFLDCNNWYMDFAASYGFQVFFNQNMFRHFDNVTMMGNSVSPNGDLFVHGLTATFRLEF